MRCDVGDCVGEAYCVQPAEDAAHAPNEASYKQQLPLFEAYDPAGLLSLLHRCTAEHTACKALSGTAFVITRDLALLLRHFTTVNSVLRNYS